MRIVRTGSVVALLAVVSLMESHAVAPRAPLFQATTTGLIAYWKLDEAAGTGTSADSAGTITGTWVGTPTVRTLPAELPPPFGGIANTACLEFDGSTSAVNLGTNLPLLNNVTGATLAYWAYYNATTANGGLSIAVGSATPTGTSRSSLEIAGTAQVQGLGRGADSDSAKTRLSAVNAVTTGVWCHLATTVDYPTGTIRVYVNGVEDTTNADNGVTIATATAATNSANGAFGASDLANAAFVNGRMDDVRVYSRVLSAAEIFALAAPAPPTGLTATGVIGSNDLQWTNGQPGATTFAVYSSPTGAAGSYTLLQAGVATNTYSDTGASTSAPTFYIVRTEGPAPITQSIDSNAASSTALVVPPPPPRTQKVGSRHMCGCSTANPTGEFAVVAVLMALALLLLARR